MDIKELLDYLGKEIPANYACSWDNCGLQVGHAGKEVKKVYIALDATEQVVRDAAMKHCDFILTHHPLLFSGIKRVTGNESIGRKLYMLIGNDIACYSAHTSFDAMPGGMGEQPPEDGTEQPGQRPGEAATGHHFEDSAPQAHDDPGPEGEVHGGLYALQHRGGYLRRCPGGAAVQDAACHAHDPDYRQCHAHPLPVQDMGQEGGV